ncbi:hypothetical protein [Lysobacter gummosus]|uniref:hypothetical protein n=1 Tax=Lysobacter gummosus TaxID=262324 RepID=UPI00362CDC2D
MRAGASQLAPVGAFSQSMAVRRWVVRGSSRGHGESPPCRHRQHERMRRQIVFTCRRRATPVFTRAAVLRAACARPAARPSRSAAANRSATAR